ncbi:MAG: FMN-binding protein [Methylococcales symbiont of Hymedesmia sp. n. MRB-2018]|nr:MAG: FMN-binding protein [Methylococcales symbiont of Hymedesmia sp. n. MRB-2018]
MSDSPENKPNELPPLPTSFSLISTLGVVAMISGFLVVLVYQYTQPMIAENQRLATERAIFKVLPTASSRLTFTLNEGTVELANDNTKGELLYAGYDKDNNFVGMALNAAEQGYQDIVKLLYGYNPSTSCITGYDVLKSTETPGFGTKITTDVAFLANFNCLDAKVNQEQTRLINVIKTVRHGTKNNPWEIDAISGSTITSNAVGRMFNKSGHKLHPVIAKNLTFLRSAKQTKEITHGQLD